MEISNPKQLKDHLQWALELELSTIPPYLCALYSLREGSNAEAAAVLRGVVIEEMLHMILVANVLNAIDGEPELARAEIVPRYPDYLAHSADQFKIGLLPFSRDAVETFLRIETPTRAGAPPEPNRYQTIGQFYAAIEEGLRRLCKEGGEKKLFVGQAQRQIGPQCWYYGSGGDAIVVTNLETALQALGEITDQGEGIDHGIFDENKEHGPEKLAHYFRFEQIHAGRRYLPTDTPGSGPTGSMFPVDWSSVHPMAPNLKPALLFEAVPAMYQLKYMAQALMQIPSGRDDGSTVGPSFEYIADERPV